jgi:hypothetical protein
VGARQDPIERRRAVGDLVEQAVAEELQHRQRRGAPHRVAEERLRV